MSVLYIKNQQGTFEGITTIKGEKGDTGPQGPAGRDYDPTVLNDYVSKTEFAFDVKTAENYPARGIFISASEPSGAIPQGCIWAVVES